NFKQQIKEKDQQSSGSGESGRGSGSDSSSNESLETVKGKDKVKKERVLNPPFSFNYLTVGEDIPVIVVDNSLLEFGTFSCCLEKNATSIERISKKAQQYAEKDPHPYSPLVRTRQGENN
uniref:Uncharacterized protein n=1 Tax=Megaselia scalaris TaxID=36166 RepID=T1GLQ6_MEGSC